MGKGEIARYEQFLLFSPCFQKACFPGASKGIIVWEWVKQLAQQMYLQLSALLEQTRAVLTLSQTSPGFHMSQVQIF